MENFMFTFQNFSLLFAAADTAGYNSAVVLNWYCITEHLYFCKTGKEELHATISQNNCHHRCTLLKNSIAYKFDEKQCNKFALAATVHSSLQAFRERMNRQMDGQTEEWMDKHTDRQRTNAWHGFLVRWRIITYTIQAHTALAKWKKQNTITTLLNY